MKPLVIKYGHNVCTLVRGSPGVLRKVLSVPDPRARFRRGFGAADRYTVYDWRTRTFPSGILDKVENMCRERGISLRIVDRPASNPISLEGVTPDLLFGITLREHQFQAMKASLLEERGFNWIATNGGKTEIIAGVCKVLLDNAGVNTLLIEPSKLLLLQTVARLQKRLGRGIPIGKVGDGYSEYDKPITVATFQTVNRRLHDPRMKKLIARCGAIMIDEGHRSSSNSVQRILRASPARWRLGFTGTMRTGNAVNDFIRRAAIGPCIYRVTNKYLMDKGYSAHAVVFAVTDESLFDRDLTAPRYRMVKGKAVEIDFLVRNKQEQDNLVTHVTYNKSIIKGLRALVEGGLKPLVLSSSIKHVELLTRECDRAGLKAYLLHGKITSGQRVARVKKFEHDPRGVLVGSSVLDEGVDVPVIGAVVLADDVKNVRQVLQRVGRGVRAKSGGLNAIVLLDFAASCGYYIAKHSLERINLYAKERFEVYDVPDYNAWLAKARKGWKGLLSSERFAQLQQKQKKLSRQNAKES